MPKSESSMARRRREQREIMRGSPFPVSYEEADRIARRRQNSTQPRYYQPTIPQVQAARHGAQAFDEAVSGQSFNKQTMYDKWRVDAVHHPFGGSGLDEVNRTASARDKMDTLHRQRRFAHETLRTFAADFSRDRVETDALVWYNEHDAFGRPTQMGGHPGALRTPEQVRGEKRGSYVKGHGGRDNARAWAVNTEADETLFGGGTLSMSEVRAAIWRMNTRAQVETVRTMSTPFHEFAAKGHSGEELYHARFGDLRDTGNFSKMARYAHDRREHMKWDTARKLLKRGMDTEGHVPPIMKTYIQAHDYDHHLAMQTYQKHLREGLVATNTAPTSQAGPLDSRIETLRSTANDAATGRRPRALSMARPMFLGQATQPQAPGLHTTSVTQVSSSVHPQNSSSSSSSSSTGR